MVKPKKSPKGKIKATGRAKRKPIKRVKRRVGASKGMKVLRSKTKGRNNSKRRATRR